jgi:hypothetical protein
MAAEQDDQKIPQHENMWIGDRNRQRNQDEGHTNGKTDLKRIS